MIDPEVVSRGERDATAFLWLQTLDDAILTAVALTFGRLRFPGSWKALGLRRVSRSWLAIGVAGGALASFLAWGVSLGLEHWGWPAPLHPVESVLEAARGSRDVVVVLLAVSVPVPVAEEAFFRGFAYRLLRARFGPWPAIVVSSILFAAVHGFELNAWLPVLPVGLVFALLTERSGSLWPAGVGHATVNAVAVLVT